MLWQILLSRIKYIYKEELEAQEIGKVDDYNYVQATNRISSGSKDHHLKEDLYRDKLKDISIYLSRIKRQQGWLEKAFKDIRHQSFGYILRDIFL